MSETKQTSDTPQGCACAPSWRDGRIRFILAVAVRFLLLFGLWVLLSGMLDAFHLGLGVFSSAFITWLSFEFFPQEVNLCGKPMAILAMISFILWLIVEIIKANWSMLKLVLRKDMIGHMDPHIVEFKSRLCNPMALTIFANSITLTPGTITVAVNGKGEFRVHAIDRLSAETLPGEMERRIGRIFGE